MNVYINELIDNLLRNFGYIPLVQFTIRSLIEMNSNIKNILYMRC